MTDEEQRCDGSGQLPGYQLAEGNLNPCPGCPKCQPRKQQSGGLRILFDGPPGLTSGRFVEVETDDGQSVNVGKWTEEGKFWVLRITKSDFPDCQPEAQPPGDTKPTLEELEEILNSPAKVPIEILPNGELVVKSEQPPGDIGEALEGVAHAFADLYSRANFSQAGTPEVEVVTEVQIARLFEKYLSEVREWVGAMEKGKADLLSDYRFVATERDRYYAEIARLRVELGEIRLVLESQDKRLHGYRQALEEARVFVDTMEVLASNPTNTDEDTAAIHGTADLMHACIAKALSPEKKEGEACGCGPAGCLVIGGVETSIVCPKCGGTGRRPIPEGEACKTYGGVGFAECPKTFEHGLCPTCKRETEGGER